MADLDQINNNQANSKLIIFDISLKCFKNWQIQKETQNFKKLLELLNSAMENETLVVCSDSNLQDLKNFFNEYDLKKGYIVANNGAIIYDYAANKIINCCYLPIWFIKCLIHYSIVLNKNLLFEDDESKNLLLNNFFMYKIPSQNSTELISEPSVFKSFNLLEARVNLSQITQISVTNQFPINPTDKVGNITNEKFFVDFLKNEVKLIYDKDFSNDYTFVSNSATKIKAIDKIMQITNNFNYNRMVFIAVNYLDNDLYKNFKKKNMKIDKIFINQNALATQKIDEKTTFLQDDNDYQDDNSIKTGKIWQD